MKKRARKAAGCSMRRLGRVGTRCVCVKANGQWKFAKTARCK